MSIPESTFEDIFDVVKTVIQTHPEIRALDPIADLKAKPTVRIHYTRKPKLNASSAYMVLKKSDKNWIGLLLGELSHFVTGAQADISIMHSKATAKSSTKRATQTWYEFVKELNEDKINKRDDISEAQARRLVALIEQLSAQGQRLKSCAVLEFVDDAGKVL
ncbi:hypothetical protein [Rhizobium skierniewicense]|uniref:hypothetical protein n=1 Tax=Rhizobium skierniewicense TaxID=984260 RepID=UPI00157475F1|nr:hypothetical protein [Rhizobium skierniewicense]NTF34276.1 hypothetical protein [Rhizobium skierniewicense]